MQIFSEAKKVFPDNARVWVYQADRKLNEYEKISISGKLNRFLNDWAAHGKKLDCSGEILHDLFIVLIVDESFEAASGCSIDSSVNFIRSIGEELNINFFDRFAIAYEDNNEIKVCSKNEFEALAAENKVNKNTIVFNNLVLDYANLKNNWKVPAHQSWQSKFFNLN
ncbi:MAG: ABC transporter ATPase [Chitinophagaceae bacterium]|nr:MAG: ABC transporter ATPase [Chitinophagaceae bacterium]